MRDVSGKRFRSLGRILAVTLVAAAAPAEIAAKTLRYAEFGPSSGARANALEWFAGELNRRSRGSLEIEFFWGSSLLNANAVLRGVGARVADLGSILAHVTPRQLRGYNIGDLPLGNADVWVGMRATYSLATTHPVLQREFDAAGVVYVTNFSTGPVQLICTRRITGLAGLSGARLRGSGAYGKIFRDLGAMVQHLPQPDTYQALDSGLLDCNQNYYYSMKAYRQYEIAPYVLELNFGQNLAFGIVMNRDAFAGLTGAEKKAVRETGSAFIDYFARRLMETIGEDRAAMVAGIGGASIEISPLPETEKDVLADAGNTYVRQWIGEATAEGKEGGALLQTYRDRINELTREMESRGYPWQR